MSEEAILTNAQLVLANTVLKGTLVIRQGCIATIEAGRSHLSAADDLEGDYLIPGIIDIHTDNLERQVQPRENARWPSRSAFLAHDAQCAIAGVTTVLDALCVGDLGFELGRNRTFREGVADLDALTESGALRVEHYLHLRCELPAPDMIPALDSVADHPRARLVSLMDHSPGVGQYRDIDRYIAMRLRQTRMTEAEIRAHIAFLIERRAALKEKQRAWLLERVRHRHLPLASHDDESSEDIARNRAEGIEISEFPVTMEAALAAHEANIAVIAGAPNIVRGGSHSGNVAAIDLLHAGTVNAFASDYVPSSLVEAAWRVAALPGLALPQAVAMITAEPARLCRFADRGQLAPGRRADLVQIRDIAGLPVIRRVWCGGQRVA